MRIRRFLPPSGFGDEGNGIGDLRFKMTKDKRQKIDALIKRIPMAGNDRDVINYALSLLDWAVSQREARRSILAYNKREGVAMELSFQPLDNIPSSDSAA